MLMVHQRNRVFVCKISCYDSRLEIHTRQQKHSGKGAKFEIKKKKILSCKYQTAFSTRNNKLKPNRIMAAGSGELILEMGFARLAVL